MNECIKRRIQELREDERKYRNLYNESLDMCRIVNANDTIIECNKTYLQNLGYTKEEVIGKSVFDHDAEQSLQTHHELIDAWKKYGQVLNREIWLKRKDGTIFPVLLSSTGVYDTDGKLIASNTVIRDITEIYQARKKIEENEAQIKKQLEELKEADELKSQFASMITHEMKTPFVPIRGYCEMLKEPGLLGELNAKQLEAVNVVFRNASRLERLIADVLDAQKLEMHKMKFNIESFDLQEFMASIQKDLVPMMKEKQIEFVNTTKDMLTISSDKNRLYQVIRNLIGNAVDFVQERGRIEINATSRGNDIIFYVKDNGIGIPKEKQEHLFKKFYQVDTSVKRKHGGTGLGLVICKGIVEGMGGKIWLKSEEGKGTTFYFSVPNERL